MMKIEEKRAFFNQLAPAWDGMQQVGPQAKSGIRNFVQCAYLAGAKTILDVGCGTGILVPHLLEAYPNARLIVELDFAEEMLAVNRAKYNDPRIVRLAADAADLPLPEGSMDSVLCFNVTPHFGNAQQAFRHLFQVLSPGGILAAGHLMSSSELNKFHGSLHGPVAHDRLPPAKELGVVFTDMGAINVAAQEQQGWYFVRAEKPR